MALSLPPGMKIGTHVAADAGDDELLFLTQLGIEYVRVHFAGHETQRGQFLAVRQRFEAAGLQIFSVVHPFYRAVEIALGYPGRDAKIARFADVIRELGAAGYHTVDYDFFLYAPLPDTGSAQTRGAFTRVFEQAQAEAEPFAFDRAYSDDDIWANYTAFIRAIIPVAEAAGIRLALHPDDPPLPALHGVARIFRNMAAMERAVAIAESPNAGILLCVGTWAEGGDAMGMDVCDAIRTFAERNRLFTVHFRNVSAPLPRFNETFLDNGCIDMTRVMRTLLKVGFEGLVIPDHFPGLTGDSDQRAALAHAIGYMRALKQAAESR